MKTYCDKLRELREKRGLKQSEVAQILETTQQVYSRYENGVNALPIHHLHQNLYAGAVASRAALTSSGEGVMSNDQS